MADILMRYRGDSKGSPEAALDSGPRAVKDYLGQFEGEEKIDIALEMASAIAGVITEETDKTAADYACETAGPVTLGLLAENVDGLRWISGVAGVAEYRSQ